MSCLPRPRLPSFLLLSTLLGLLASQALLAAEAPIDRQALLSRNSPHYHEVHPEAPLTIGNGGFAFTADITGLQSFGEEYQARSMPLETLSRWAWIEDANPEGYTLAAASKPYRQADGSMLAFPTEASTPAGQWLRRNPRDFPLAVLSLCWNKPDGTTFRLADVGMPEQELDLWSGVLSSRFLLGGQPVSVRTSCAPDADQLAVELESPLVAEGSLSVQLRFPRGHDVRVKNTPPLDWGDPAGHASVLATPHLIERKVAGLSYKVLCSEALEAGAGPHAFTVRRQGARVAFTLAFARSDRALAEPREALRVRALSAQHWEAFWKQAAVLDLSGSRDPRAAVLERRVLLSQFLCATQLAGEVPPQESGLMCSTWYGKHHTEMIWWHAAHFALWGHAELLARNLDWYQARLPEARALAQSRGLRGARWAKMVGPTGRESPGGNPLIYWNQPHPVYLSELLYREQPTRATLERWRDLVFETADCLASLAHHDEGRDRYVLGPPLWIAQEIHDPQTSQNPAYELAYWGWALGLAQEWRLRLGLPREPRWDEVIHKLSPLPVDGGRYVALESHPDTWTTLASRHDHPEMLMALGFLPANPLTDPRIMGRTLDAVLASWDWETKIWGWDYPMIAMTATRLGRPQDAVDILLREGPNNRYLPNGSCPQRSDVAIGPGVAGPGRPEIATYLPANGALLSAVALMVAGWDGCESEHPGFPKDGNWTLRAEGWKRMP